MNQERIIKVLLGPHVSEKASLAAERGQYVFRVAPMLPSPRSRKPLSSCSTSPSKVFRF